MNNQEKDFLQKQIADLTGNSGFTMSDKDYDTFLQIVKGMTFEAGTSEMALAFVTIAVMDKDKFILSRNNREYDFKVLVNTILDIYKNRKEAKSTLLLTVEALDKYTDMTEIELRKSIIMSDCFDFAIGLFKPRALTQPAFTVGKPTK